MSLFDRWAVTLDQLQAQGRYRRFALPKGIDFTSNDYLGYGSSPPGPAEPDARSEGDTDGPDAFTSRVGLGQTFDATTLSRTGMASRLLRGHHAVWDEVEEKLTAWHGTEAVLMMTSGYAANEGLISTIMEPGDWVATDELNHACIVDGLRLAKCRRYSFKHNDLNHLEDGLKAEAAKNDPDRARFIITEALFSMDGDCAPLPDLADLAERYGAHLIVDEAHSTGCFGISGSGCVDESGVRDQVLASIHTGGKALGVTGAYIAGSKLLKEYLTNRCRHLIFTTALPAAVGGWWRETLPRVEADAATRRALRWKAGLFRHELSGYGVEPLGTEYIVPVVVGDDARAVAAATRLQGQGFDVRAIRPPSVAPGTARLRISIHADHGRDILVGLAAAVADALEHV